MIKCPNCGSTAQVRTIKCLGGHFSVPNRTNEMKTRCKCGCGCRFTYQLIIDYKNETWKEDWVDINRKK